MQQPSQSDHKHFNFEHSHICMRKHFKTPNLVLLIFHTARNNRLYLVKQAFVYNASKSSFFFSLVAKAFSSLFFMSMYIASAIIFSTCTAFLRLKLLLCCISNSALWASNHLLKIDMLESGFTRCVEVERKVKNNMP